MKFSILPSLVFAALLTVLSLTGTSTAAPAADFEGLDKQARDILARATPAAPHFVVYSDKGTSGITGPPPPSQVNVCVILLLHYYPIFHESVMLTGDSMLTVFPFDYHRDLTSCEHITHFITQSRCHDH